MTGRNDPCPCGSGKRYKHCHGAAAESPDVLARQGVDAHRRSDVPEAERLYRRALALAPDHPLALHYLGVALYQQKRLDEAMPLLDRAAALVPGEPEFHNNRGLALAASLRDADAVAAYRRALELDPRHAGAWSNLGLALQATGDIEGAIEAFRNGLAVATDFPQLHWNLALALLLVGDYARGWREYEWRLRTPELAAQVRAIRRPTMGRRGCDRQDHPRHRRARSWRHHPVPALRIAARRPRRARDRCGAGAVTRARVDGARRRAIDRARRPVAAVRCLRSVDVASRTTWASRSTT